MLKARWLLPLLLLAAIAGIVVVYRDRIASLKKSELPKPAALPVELASKAEDWTYNQTDSDGRPVVEVRARNVKQSKDDNRIDLENVQLKIFQKDQQSYDLVRSASAQFFPAEKRMYSDGAVQITLNLPMTGEATRPPVTIHSSGVSFDSATGKATTTQPTTFLFENGDGASTGATYDPTTKELLLPDAVTLNWRSPQPGAKPMKLESGQLVYKELDQTIALSPWARLTRERSVIEGAGTLVYLVEGAITKVETQQARGRDEYPNRKLEYAADQMLIEFAEKNTVRKVTGASKARLVSTSATAATTVNSDSVELDFAAGGGDSVLTHALASGRSVVESKPAAAAGGGVRPETRVLRSEVIDLRMRPGGEEIDTVDTLTPGTLEFLPNAPAQRKRRLDGERIHMAYGQANRLKDFRSTRVTTETEPNAAERARKRGVVRTRSDEMTAEFDPKSGDMTQMRQSGAFEYAENDRRATAATATLESAKNLITLETGARMWDPTGATAGDRIRIDQASGDFTAEGKVNSTRQPEKRAAAAKNEGGLLDDRQPMQAKARRMISTRNNRHIVYEEDVVMWQGANRITADRAEIDRDARTLLATGTVFTQLLEKKAAQPGGYTAVRSRRLLYTESDKLAYYTGGVLLNRGGLQVKSAELRAYLTEDEGGSELEKAIADGRVEIVRSADGKTRQGFGEHAEYFTGEEKIYLTGGDPRFIDADQAVTRGRELTYFANDDRLQVTGSSERPAFSRIRRR